MICRFADCQEMWALVSTPALWGIRLASSTTIEGLLINQTRSFKTTVRSLVSCAWTYGVLNKKLRKEKKLSFPTANHGGQAVKLMINEYMPTNKCTQTEKISFALVSSTPLSMVPIKCFATFVAFNSCARRSFYSFSRARTRRTQLLPQATSRNQVIPQTLEMVFYFTRYSSGSFTLLRRVVPPKRVLMTFWG